MRHTLSAMTSAALRDPLGADPHRAVLHPAPVALPARVGTDAESLLRAALPIYRSALQGAWTANTAHAAYRNQFASGNPTGQCGVSSAWLVHRLYADFGIAGTYCYGSLAIGDPAEVMIARHCWVELSWAAVVYVIDLTADQAPGFNERIVFGPKGRLLSDEHLHYDARMRKSRQELIDDDVWPRVVTLNDELVSLSGGTART